MLIFENSRSFFPDNPKNTTIVYRVATFLQAGVQIGSDQTFSVTVSNGRYKLDSASASFEVVEKQKEVVVRSSDIGDGDGNRNERIPVGRLSL